MRRTDYKPQGSQESFIVPLLENKITSALHLIGQDLFGPQLTERNVLDCGCGNQPLRKKLQSIGLKYESLDITQNCETNVDYVCSIDAQVEQFQSVVHTKYDLVICTEVLEHVRDLQMAFRNLFASSNPGGFAILTIPFFYPLHEEPFDFCRPTPHLIQSLAKDAGYHVISIEKAGSAVEVMGTLLGAVRLRYDCPKSFSEKIYNRLLLLAQSTLFRHLQKNTARIVADNDGIYLSNIAILRKPSNYN